MPIGRAIIVYKKLKKFTLHLTNMEFRNASIQAATIVHHMLTDERLRDGHIHSVSKCGRSCMRYDELRLVIISCGRGDCDCISIKAFIHSVELSQLRSFMYVVKHYCSVLATYRLPTDHVVNNLKRTINIVITLVTTQLKTSNKLMCHDVLKGSAAIGARESQ